MYDLFSESKSADQLHIFCSAYLHVYFLIGKNGFSHNAAQIV